MADGVYTEAGGRRKISDGQRRKGSDGTGTRAALSRGFESLALWKEPLRAIRAAREQHLVTTDSEVTLIEKGSVFPARDIVRIIKMFSPT